MRDPNRIEPTLKVIAEVWKKYPDLRLGQIIVIAASKAVPNGDPFMMEDDKLIEVLRDLK